ncbi:MAG: hypothetical protein JNJ89_09780 [Rubrivivax sp.]|nr:hypothetical protein [Rubrivivax sp.]
MIPIIRLTRNRSSLRRAVPGMLAACALAAAAFAGLPPVEAGAWGKPARTAGRPGGAVAAPPVVTLAQARESFLAQRYAEAYGRFAELADRGDGVAAWMALMLVCTGPAIFGGGDWSATPGQLLRWTALAARHTEQRSAAISGHERRE